MSHKNEKFKNFKIQRKSNEKLLLRNTFEIQGNKGENAKIQENIGDITKIAQNIGVVGNIEGVGGMDFVSKRKKRNLRA